MADQRIFEKILRGEDSARNTMSGGTNLMATNGRIANNTDTTTPSSRPSATASHEIAKGRSTGIKFLKTMGMTF